LCVQYSGDNTFYPAAVYIVNSGGETHVRLIDNNVAELINHADVTAHTGDDNTGGGVILISTTAGSTSTKAYLEVDMGPQAALDQGGGWQLPGATNYIHQPSALTYFTNGGPKTIVFNPVQGWDLVTSTNVTLVLGQKVIVSASYTVEPPVMMIRPGIGISITGTTNTKYRLEQRTSLRTGSWMPIMTNTITGGFNLLLPWPPTNGAASFYRAVWLP
jgi:hypothetical protein